MKFWYVAQGFTQTDGIVEAENRAEALLKARQEAEGDIMQVESIDVGEIDNESDYKEPFE